MGGPGSGRKKGSGMSARQSAKIYAKQTGSKKSIMSPNKINSTIKQNRAKNVISARNYKNKEKTALSTIGVSGTKSAKSHVLGLRNKITKIKSGRY